MNDTLDNKKFIDKKVVRKASFATFALFFIFGTLVNSWYSRIPSVRDSMDLSALELSQILIVAALGSILGLPFVGYMNEKFGARKVIIISISGFVFLMFGVLYSLCTKNIVMVCIYLFLAHFVMSFCEGTVNIEGGRIEIAMQKSIISAYHGGFSLGTVFSAIVASIVSHLGVSIYYHLTSIYILSLILMVIASVYILPYEYLRTVFMFGYIPPKDADKNDKVDSADKNLENQGQGTKTRNSAWFEKRTLLIGVTILGSALTEGAANDWLSLSLVQSFGKTEAFGAMALGIFVASMTITRMSASPFVGKFGRVRVLRFCTALGGIGLLLFVFSPWVELCLVGIVAWAIGSALGFPLGMSAASDDPLKASERVAVTSTIGYGAFFLGPAIVGFIAEYVGYRMSLVVIMIPIVLALIFIPVLKPLPTRDMMEAEKIK
ncbi:MFS transporter [Actinomyces sp. zg-332]|uniref:MFS transporter n=1 Tax=Actinomyces sp. zg-332 TaxID=2708340 RepID=UPI00141E0CEA|nr:MFS transporter [Actinomyces sp. zg-332]QPK94003.1 MFS transporter [Actinomyces sp. zg-332]